MKALSHGPRLLNAVLPNAEEALIMAIKNAGWAQTHGFRCGDRRFSGPEQTKRSRHNPRDNPLFQGRRSLGAGRPETKEEELRRGYWHHPEIEEDTVGVVMNYTDEHWEEQLNIEFADGESYIATFFTAYESENTGELDIDEDDPRYDQFYVVSFDIVAILQDGARRYNDSLSIDYRDFPTRITNFATGQIVYQST